MSSTLSSHEIQWAHRKWCEGYTLEQIGNVLYISKESLSYVLKQEGLTRTRRPLEYGPETQSAYLRDASDYNLARELLDIASFKPYCRNHKSCINLGDAVPRERCRVCLMDWLQTKREEGTL